MALYVPYVVGSVSFAYLSGSIYSYMYGDMDEKSDTDNTHNDTTIVTIPDENIINMENIKPIKQKLYKCHICNKDLSLEEFSKNQQKKQYCLWKCKMCTKKLN